MLRPAVAHGVILLGREAEQPVAGRVRRDVRLIEPADGKRERDAPVRALHRRGVVGVHRAFVLVDKNAVIRSARWQPP